MVFTDRFTKKTRAHSGYSLIELVFSMVVFTFGTLSLLFGIIGSSLRSQNNLIETNASLLATECLNQMASLRFDELIKSQNDSIVTLRLGEMNTVVKKDLSLDQDNSIKQSVSGNSASDGFYTSEVLIKPSITTVTKSFANEPILLLLTVEYTHTDTKKNEKPPKAYKILKSITHDI